MKSKFFVLILMATVLLNLPSQAQSLNTKKKIESIKDKVFFGKKSYNYKSFGKQNVDDNLKKAKERLKKFSSKNQTAKFKSSASKSADYSNSRRKKKGYSGKSSKYNRYDNDTHYYPEKFKRHDSFYGFSTRDFGYENTFYPNLERADEITENMDRLLDLSRNQAYDVFRLNVLFISDMSQLMYGSNAYAYGASYGDHYMDYQVRDLITENYLHALSEILKNSQERRLDNYFRRYDLMGNSLYGRYNSYSYNRYGRCDD